MDEKLLVIIRANEEAQHLHQEDLDGTPNPAGAIILTEHNWNTNGTGLAFLQHYRKCILKGLKKGAPKQKSLNIQALQQKPNEDCSKFLEDLSGLYEGHWC